jgi:hypothetical protein
LTPLVVQLTIEGGPSFRLPLPLPSLTLSLLELGVFDRLESLTVRHGNYADDFLAAVLHPSSPNRSTLRELRIDSCGTREGDQALELSLAFAFEAYSLSDSSMVLDWTELGDLTVERVLRDTGREGEEMTEDERENDLWDERYDLADEASLDFSLYRRIWESFDELSIPLEFPRRNPFTALSTLHIHLSSVGPLHLIIYTSSFPALRQLRLSDGSKFGISMDDLESLRRSVTPFVHFLFH